MKAIITTLGHTLPTTALLVAGFGLHSVVDAPGWLMAVFTLPCLI
jgi:hypothetical protein